MPSLSGEFPNQFQRESIKLVCSQLHLPFIWLARIFVIAGWCCTTWSRKWNAPARRISGSSTLSGQRLQPPRSFITISLCQYMTPETGSTSHFFWNYLHDFKQDNPNVPVSLRDSLLEGFMEDKVIILAQQKLLEQEEPFQARGLVADVALSHFRKTWQKLIKQERADVILYNTIITGAGHGEILSR